MNETSTATAEPATAPADLYPNEAAAYQKLEEILALVKPVVSPSTYLQLESLFELVKFMRNPIGVIALADTICIAVEDALR